MWEIWIYEKRDDGKLLETFVGETKCGDLDEIVKACQVLYPDMVGVFVKPDGAEILDEA